MREEFARSALLLGEEAEARLARASVAVFGIGGVGGHAAEAVARAAAARKAGLHAYVLVLDGDAALR